MDEVDNKFRSRKWILTCAIQLGATLALALGWGGFTGADYALISSTNAAAYSFSNAAVYWAKRE